MINKNDQIASISCLSVVIQIFAYSQLLLPSPRHLHSHISHNMAPLDEEHMLPILFPFTVL